MQFIDVRDLGAWMLTMIEQRAGGAFNATNEGVPMAEFLAACPGEVEVVWVDDEFLVEHGVGEWMELPLWVGDRRVRRPAQGRRVKGDRRRPDVPPASRRPPPTRSNGTAAEQRRSR